MSPRAKRLLTALGGVLTAASAVLLPAAPGAAAATPETTPEIAPSSVTSIPLTRTRAELQKVIDYWTPARLKAADSFIPSRKGSVSTPAPGSTTTATSASGTATSGTPGNRTVRPTAAKAAVNNATRQAGYPATVGKVFFRIGTKEYWCSATAVHSPGKNLVATAGHCTFDVKQAKPVADWIFIPGYAGGDTSSGIYVGHTLNLHERFAHLGDYDYDYAFVTVHRGFVWQPQRDAAGRTKKDAKGNVLYQAVDVGHLEDRVGAQGIVWNRGTKVTVIAFGYPAGPHPNGTRPFDGQSLKWCRTTGTRVTPAPTWQVNRGLLFKCTFTSGASGGPWLVGYNSKDGTGYLNGVNSLTWDTDADGRNDHISSPYFNGATAAVYRYATTQRT